jgi:hypothetical protein
MKLKVRENLDEAEVIALKALTFLVSDEDRLSGFLALSGMDLQDLKEQATDINTLAGLLDHVLAHENLLVEFARSLSCRPESIMCARHKLPGANNDA